MDLKLDDQNIISILGIQSLDEARKAEILDQASGLIQKRLLVRVMESLDDAKRQEFEGLLEKNDPAALESFMTANTPDFTQWVLEEVNKLKGQFADIASNLE